MTRVALTQGASRGLGLAFAHALLDRADVDRVVATCRDPEASEGLARLLSEHDDALLAAERLFGVRRAAEQLLGVIDSCTREDSGRFLAWDGQPIPW